MGLDMKLFGQFVPGTDSWISFSLMKTQENLSGIKVPRPTDQRYSFALFFQDYVPKFPKYKISLKAIFADGFAYQFTPSRQGIGLFSCAFLQTCRYRCFPYISGWRRQVDAKRCVPLLEKRMDRNRRIQPVRYQ